MVMKWEVTEGRPGRDIKGGTAMFGSDNTERDHGAPGMNVTSLDGRAASPELNPERPTNHHRDIEFCLIARRGRVMGTAGSCTTLLVLGPRSTLSDMMERLGQRHGFTPSRPSTLHVDPLPGHDGPLWHPGGSRGGRFRLGGCDEPVHRDDLRAVDAVLPPGATGYLCVGLGQWLWYVRSMEGQGAT
jgi:hypothetical protein